MPVLMERHAPMGTITMAIQIMRGENAKGLLRKAKVLLSDQRDDQDHWIQTDWLLGSTLGHLTVELTKFEFTF